MATTPNKDKVPSNSVQNLLFNSEKLDEVINSTSLTYVDRLDSERLTIKGLEEAAVSAGPTVQAAAEALRQANETKKNSDAIIAATEGYIEGAKASSEDARISATESAKFAVRAKEAAESAESVVDVEGTYPTVAAGIAATAEGKYFRVPQGVGDRLSFIYYRKSGSSAIAAAESIGNPDVLSLDRSGYTGEWMYNTSILGSNATHDRVTVRRGEGISTGTSVYIPLSSTERHYFAMPVGTFDRFRILGIDRIPANGDTWPASAYNYTGDSNFDTSYSMVTIGGVPHGVMDYLPGEGVNSVLIYQHQNGGRADVQVSLAPASGFLPVSPHQEYVIKNDLAFSDKTKRSISASVREGMGGNNTLVGSSSSAEILEWVGIGYGSAGETAILTPDVVYGAGVRTWANEVRPGATYTLTVLQPEEGFTRFRVALSNEVPRRRTVVSRLLSGLDVGSQYKTVVGVDGRTYRHITFTTSETEKWVILTPTQTSQDVQFSITEGGFAQGETEVSSANSVVFGQAVHAPVLIAGAIESPMFSRGKNLFNGEYFYGLSPDHGSAVEGYYSTPLRTARGTGDDNLKDVVALTLPCLPRTKYAVSRFGGSRFFIGTSQNYPNSITTGAHPGMMHEVVNDNSLNSYVFETVDTDRFITVYLSNTGGVEWCQVEKNDRVTAYETFGWRFSQAAVLVQSSASGAGAGYISAGAGDGFVDDSDDLQAVLNLITGAISFDPSKKYFLGKTLNVNASVAKGLYGNRATFIVGGDFPAFTVKGGMTSGSANPATNGARARSEGGFIVDGIRAYSQDLVSGVGVSLSGMFKPRIQNCDLMYLKHGMQFSGLNRDVIATNNHIYACHDYGLYFDDSSDIHQLNVIGNIITYCTRNIFLDNADIFNLQIVGNDIELGTYPADVVAADKADIWIKAITSYVEDISVIGNTLEDHWTADRLVKFEGGATGRVRSVVVSGNSSGNSLRGEIEIGGATGVCIGGQFKKSYGDTLIFTGAVNGLTMSVQALKEGGQGGLLSCNGPYPLTNISVTGCQMNGAGAHRAIRLLGKPTLTNVTISGNSLHDRSTETPIIIDAALTDGVRIDFNQIRNTGNTSGQAVWISAGSIADKNSMLFNSATKGGFNAPAGFNAQGNF